MSETEPGGTGPAVIPTAQGIEFGTTDPGPEGGVPPATKVRGQFAMVAARFVRNPLAMIGLAIFLILLFGSLIIPYFWKYNSSQITSDFATAPSLNHPFGTDLIGHDLFAQTLSGTLISMETALLVAVVSTIVGTLIGALAGYYGGVIDQILMRFTDLVLVVPALAILLVLSNKFSTQSDSQLFIGLLLALLFWTYLARLIRGTFMSLREREFIEAEHAIGASTWRIILRHLIPNATGSIVVNGTLTVANAMLTESILSFLGLGIQPPAVDLGQLIDAAEGDAVSLPWLFYFPSAALVLAILSVNFIGDGLRDALDPTQRGS